MIINVINCIIWITIFLITINFDEIDKRSYILMFIELLIYIIKDITHYMGV